mmetsp:Transcript_28680/g.67384  ORF Transcript_28680/g.67384 Transcript_28680/m.67384 type:complete len:89 (-) Transcript_28680:17-283(-)
MVELFSTYVKADQLEIIILSIIFIVSSIGLSCTIKIIGCSLLPEQLPVTQSQFDQRTYLHKFVQYSLERSTVKDTTTGDDTSSDIRPF